VCTVPLYIFSIFIFSLQFKALEFWRRGEVRFVRQVRLFGSFRVDSRGGNGTEQLSKDVMARALLLGEH
jgi:hypothetical protein